MEYKIGDVVLLKAKIKRADRADYAYPYLFKGGLRASPDEIIALVSRDDQSAPAPSVPVIPAGWTPVEVVPQDRQNRQNTEDYADALRDVMGLRRNGKERPVWHDTLDNKWYVYRKKYPREYRLARPGEIIAWREIE